MDDRTTKQQVEEWSAVMRSLPSWEEMLEVEYVRQRGENNMFSDWTRWAFDRGLYHAVTWWKRVHDLRRAHSGIYDLAYKNFDETHGPRAKWITPELKAKFLRVELQERRRTLEAQIRDVERQAAEMQCGLDE